MTDLARFYETLYEKHKCFAVLRPLNATAVGAFSDVCDAIDNDPEAFASSTTFMVRNARATFAQACEHAQVVLQEPSSVTSLLAHDSGDTSFSSDTTILDDQRDPNLLVHTGCFILSCELPPKFPRIGWRAGTSHRDVRRGPPELLLTVDRSHAVRSAHVICNWLHDSGALGIRAPHDNPLASYGTQTLARAKGFVVVDAEDGILTVGPLAYRLMYVVPPLFEQAFHRGKAKYMEEMLGLEQPIESASITPSDRDLQLGRWKLLKTAGMGTQSVIQAALADDNTLVAVKHVVRKDSRTAETLETEIRNFRAFTDRIPDADPGSRHLLKLRDVIYTSGSADYGNVSKGADDVYILSAPLVRGDFRRRVISADEPVSRDIKIKLFAQVLRGIATIHEAGYIHRDLKPENLGALSLRQPFAVVLDYGHMIHTPRDTQTGVDCTPGFNGTLGYHAPEMEVIHGVYGQPVDMFALGCVGFELFAGEGRLIGSAFNPFRDPPANVAAATKETIAKAQLRYFESLEQLEECPFDSIEGLLASLLKRFPWQRLRAQDALQHTVIAQALRGADAVEGGTSSAGRKRRLSNRR